MACPPSANTYKFLTKRFEVQLTTSTPQFDRAFTRHTHTHRSIIPRAAFLHIRVR